jgi:hypothetical protein
MDVILSGQRLPRLSPLIPLILGHHFVRIAYEGAHALRSSNPHLGVPELADLLTDKYASVTARARHVSKLLDDSKKTYETVIAEFDAIAQEHHDQFTGNAFRWARRFETDLGLYVAEGRLLGATWPAAYRLGLSVNAEGSISGQDLRAVTEEWGGTLAVLGSATLDSTSPIPTLDLTRSPWPARRKASRATWPGPTTETSSPGPILERRHRTASTYTCASPSPIESPDPTPARTPVDSTRTSTERGLTSCPSRTPFPTAHASRGGAFVPPPPQRRAMAWFRISSRGPLCLIRRGSRLGEPKCGFA